jgi:hypothetical protein
MGINSYSIFEYFIIQSFDSEQKVTHGIHQSQRGHSTSHNCQDLDHEVIEMGLVLAVDDVNGLDFSHEHNTFQRILYQFNGT